ncbi:MAG: hypothetical protein AAFX04_10850 [Pseudomonadota bacterium]
MRLKATAAIPITLALLLGTVSAVAQGVSTATEATAEFDNALKSGPRASTYEDAMMCAGYWFALKDLHGISKDVSFFQQLPSRLDEDTADKGHKYWGAVVASHYDGDRAKLEAAGDRVGEYRKQMLQRFVDGLETGKIIGVFNTLGSCVPS